MSKVINGLRWRSGAEICRVVCNELSANGMSVVNWVDLSEKDDDPREDMRFNLQLVFTIVSAQKDGRFTNVLQMVALPQDGRCTKLCDWVDVPEGRGGIDEEDVACLIHNVVDDDSEPQYVPICDVLEHDDFPCMWHSGDGFYISSGVADTSIAYYDNTEYPFNGDDPVGDVEAEEWDRANAELNETVKGLSLESFKGIVKMIKGFVEASNG